VPIKEANLDPRFSTLLKRWSERVDEKLLAQARAAAPVPAKIKGKHPEAAAAAKNVPASCLKCHSKESTKAPPLARLAHLIHLTGGEANHFLTVYQGECTHCHKLDPKSGAWRIPSAAEK